MPGVFVVVGNASDTFGLATQTTTRLQELGYVFVVRSDGITESEDTAIYFADGYEGEARRLAFQIGVPLSLIEPMPDEPIVEGNADEDLLLYLGNDWRDVTNLDS
jgi:hypothetical protein